jgi:hypothetical protein
MRLSTVSIAEVAEPLRFDSKYHLSRQNPLLQQLKRGGWETETLGGLFGHANIWTGNIFTRVYATSSEHGKPLLVPYDLFRYVPWSDKILSRSQVTQFEQLEIKRGWMFIVCSGRNLGPLALADSFCEQFAMSHDMVRIATDPTDVLFYTAAFLSTAHGQATIRTDMNGSVIDHTDGNMVAQIRVPLVDAGVRSFCASSFAEAFETREAARLLLARTGASFLRLLELDGACPSRDAQIRRFTVPRSALSTRIDAEPAAPIYAALRERIRAIGGVPLNQLADVHKPASRYKTKYVESSKYGVPMLNGRQIAQCRPIALKLMNLSDFKDPSPFLLQEGTTLLTADGRAEENLADCALVTSDRVGWAASGHVHRVTPRPGVSPGLIYLGAASTPVQLQLKALATGSVVDALSEEDVASVLVPFSESKAIQALAKHAETAWNLFAAASSKETAAITALETELAGQTS